MTKHILSLLILTIFTMYGFSQNVGIDVLEPLGKLHIKVNSTSGNPHLRLTEDGDDYARIKLESGVNLPAFWEIAGKADSVTNNSLLNLYFQNNNTSGNRMTILGNGNVGINNNNPLSKLDIQNVGDGNELLRFTTDRPWVFKQTSSGINTRLTLQSTVNDKFFDIVSPNGNTKLAEYFVSDLNPKIILLADGGKLGIGTTNPGNKVAIQGDASSTGHVLSVTTAYTGSAQVRAVEGFSNPSTGKGYGGFFEGGYRGVKANSYGNSSTDWSIGVEASAYGTAGTRIGVFGRGVGGTTNWAGYFAEGDVYVTNELRVGFGAINGASGYKVAIDGKLIAEEVRVQSSGAWPDYVFEENYRLTPLKDLEKKIENIGHLPGVPSAKEVEEGGIILGEMQRVLLEKIEELTLYTIDLQKQMESLKSELASIKSNK